MKKYSVVETNPKGTTIKVKFQTNDSQKAHKILSDFRSEDTETEFHILSCED